MQARTLLVVAALALGGCGSAPQVSTDRFYQLQDTAVSVGPPLTNGALLVQEFKSDGLRSERALLYVPSEGSAALEQHHYRFWSDAPPRMLQRELVAYLRAAGAAPVVVDEIMRGSAALIVRGRLLRFEYETGRVAQAHVAMELRLDRANSGPILARAYSASVPIGEVTVEHAVAAIDQGVGEIFAQFLADMRTVVGEAP